mmetsp:Transcript_1686/g.5416  ORF Transcript_1686/g.5416 Transcript_1686/m.5416 type:complete len:193 (+) Transcript_1686:55-633(+)
MSDGDCLMAAPRCPPKLRLPDIRPPPEPTEEELRLAAALEEAAEEKRQRCGQGLGTVQWQRRPPAACGRSSLEDFLGGSPRGRGRAGSRGGRHTRVTRPTQRQSIDDNTSVPADLHERMMRLGAEARSRAGHTLAFRPVTGRPYLRRRDDEVEEVAPERLEEEAAMARSLAELAPRNSLRPSVACDALVMAH